MALNTNKTGNHVNYQL